MHKHTPSCSNSMRAQHLLGPCVSPRGLTPLAEMSIHTDLKLFFNMYKILSSRAACMHPLFLSNHSDQNQVGHIFTPRVSHVQTLSKPKPRQMTESLIKMLLKTHKNAKTKLSQLSNAVMLHETVTLSRSPPIASRARRWTS